MELRLYIPSDPAITAEVIGRELIAPIAGWTNVDRNQCSAASANQVPLQRPVSPVLVRACGLAERGYERGIGRFDHERRFVRGLAHSSLDLNVISPRNQAGRDHNPSNGLIACD